MACGCVGVDGARGDVVADKLAFGGYAPNWWMGLDAWVECALFIGDGFIGCDAPQLRFRPEARLPKSAKGSLLVASMDCDGGGCCCCGDVSLLVGNNGILFALRFKLAAKSNGTAWFTLLLNALKFKLLKSGNVELIGFVLAWAAALNEPKMSSRPGSFVCELLRRSGIALLPWASAISNDPSRSKLRSLGRAAAFCAPLFDKCNRSTSWFWATSGKTSATDAAIGGEGGGMASWPVATLSAWLGNTGVTGLGGGAGRDGGFVGRGGGLEWIVDCAFNGFVTMESMDK